MAFEDYHWPAREGLKPFQHQIETVKFQLVNKRGFVLNQMGTGKTLSSLWATDILFCEKKIRKVLIICNISTMRSVWLREIRLNFPNRRVAIAHGTKQFRVQMIKSGVEYVIINHDGIVSCLQELMAERFDCIIIDELTAYKTFSANRTKCMIKLAKTARAVWGLTGKPTPNSPLEAFSQAHVVNPGNRFLPRYFTEYRDMTMMRINTFTWIPKEGAVNIAAAILSPAICYKLKDCVDMPPMTTQTLEIPFTPAQNKAYEEMRQQLYTEVGRGEISAANAAVKVGKLMQISAGAVIDDEGSIRVIDCKPRLNALLEIYQEAPTKKLIIFCTYRASIHIVEEFLNANNIKTKSIYGDVSNKDRDIFIREFQDSDLNALVIQPQSAAHGITLTASCVTIWFSLIQSNEYYQQGNARMYRPGQVNPCVVLHLISSKIESHVANMLSRKDYQADSVLDIIKNHDL